MGLRYSKAASTEAMTLEEVARRPLLAPAEVNLLHLVSPAMYATFAALVYNDPGNRIKCPEGWEPFLDCATVQLDREGYYAAAYVNRATRQCVIAQRGTSEVLALRAGVWVYFEEPTIQFYLAEQFSKQVRLAISLMPHPEEWVVSYTGHSLGAVLAACRAVEEDTVAVTFESPGSRTFIRKTGHPYTPSIDAAIIAYVRPPNPINTLKPHCGYMVMLPATGPGTTGGATSLMLLPPTDSSPPEGAARSPIIAELPSGGDSQSGRAVGGGVDSRAAAPSRSPSRPPSPSPPRPSMFSPSRLKLPSLRPQVYLRDYVLGNSGFGIPELQQYVSKVEPLIREMLERTQQLHAIHGILEHFFAGGGACAGEMVVERWPSHLMQFMEYYNTTRALEDPENQSAHVNAAYKAMMRRLFSVRPRPADRIPLRFINEDSKKMVQLWWSWEPARRKALPLTVLEHKTLNCITIDGDVLRATVLDAFHAKQFLALLVRRPELLPIINRVWTNGDGTVAVPSML